MFYITYNYNYKIPYSKPSQVVVDFLTVGVLFDSQKYKLRFGKYQRWVGQIPKIIYSSFLQCMNNEILVSGLSQQSYAR